MRQRDTRRSTIIIIYNMMTIHSLCKKMGTSGADPPFFFLDDIILYIIDCYILCSVARAEMVQYNILYIYKSAEGGIGKYRAGCG